MRTSSPLTSGHSARSAFDVAASFSSRQNSVDYEYGYRQYDASIAYILVDYSAGTHNRCGKCLVLRPTPSVLLLLRQKHARHSRQRIVDIEELRYRRGERAPSRTPRTSEWIATSTFPFRAARERSARHNGGYGGSGDKSSDDGAEA